MPNRSDPKPGPPPAYKPTARAGAAQAKRVAPPVFRLKPAGVAAPPVYNPFVTKTAAQPKKAAAPSVYKPHPAAGAQPLARTSAVQVPSPPPVYRPYSQPPLNTKAPPVYRPGTTGQLFPNPISGLRRAAAPAHSRSSLNLPSVQPRRVVQRLNEHGYIAARAADPFLAMQDTGLTDANWGLMRHHIIPVKLLTDFFNAVKERKDQNHHHQRGYRGTFTGVLKNIASKGYGGGYQYTSLTSAMRAKQEKALEEDEYKFRHAEKRKWTNVLTYGNLSQMGEFMKEVPTGPAKLNHELVAEGFVEKALAAEPDEKDSSSISLIISMYHWLPGNLFEGPKDRADDPTGEAKPENEQIDSGVQHIIGKSAYAVYAKTCAAMLNYVNKKGDEEDQSANLEDAVEGYGKIAERGAPYPYNRSDWELDEATGKPKIKVTNKT